MGAALSHTVRNGKDGETGKDFAEIARVDAQDSNAPSVGMENLRAFNAAMTAGKRLVRWYTSSKVTWFNTFLMQILGRRGGNGRPKLYSFRKMDINWLCDHEEWTKASRQRKNN